MRNIKIYIMYKGIYKFLDYHYNINKDITVSDMIKEFEESMYNRKTRSKILHKIEKLIR